MARLCIRILPNDADDPKLDALRSKPGDVICVVNDKHEFTFAELNCGHYKIIDLPDVDPSELEYLVEPEKIVDLGSPDGTTTGRYRAQSVDWTALGKTATKVDLDKAVTVKPSVSVDG